MPLAAVVPVYVFHLMLPPPVAMSPATSKAAAGAVVPIPTLPCGVILIRSFHETGLTPPLAFWNIMVLPAIEIDEAVPL